MEDDRIASRILSFLIDCSLPIVVVVGLGFLLPALDRNFSWETRASDTTLQKELAKVPSGVPQAKEKRSPLEVLSEKTAPAAITEVTREPIGSK